MNSRNCGLSSLSIIAGLIPTLLLGLVLTGCGNKGYPKPMTEEAPPPIRDLRAQIRGSGVELSWSTSDALKALAKEERYSVAILKSEVRWENRNCLDCPAPTQQEVLRLDPQHPTPARVEGERLLWTDPSVSLNHAYRYQIAVQDEKRRTVVLSNPSIAKVIPPPAPVQNLSAATGPQGILLKWKPPKKDAQGHALQGDLQFLIERQANSSPWEKISSVPVKATTFQDPAVASNQVYAYRVTPFVLFEDTPIHGESSTVQGARAPDAIPPPPPSTVWVIPSKGGMEVQWTESEGRVTGYHVYRREGKEIIRLTASPVQRPPYMDRSVRKNAVYFYAVSAVGTQDAKEGLLSKWAEIRSLLFEQ